MGFTIPANHHRPHIGDPLKEIQLAETGTGSNTISANPCPISEHHANITPPPSANQTPDTDHTTKTPTDGLPMARGSKVFIGVFLGVLFCGLGWAFWERKKRQKKMACWLWVLVDNRSVC